MNTLTQTYAQPWPLCWQLMQWDLALWSSLPHAGRTMQVVWSESRLKQDIGPQDFQHAVHAFRQALSQQWGDHLVWQIDAATSASGHTIRIGFSAATGERPT